jgi:hypothetical protein
MAATEHDGTTRAARWLAAQTAVVALLAGIVHRLALSTLLEGGMSYLGAGISGVGAVVGLRAVQGFVLAGAVLFACWPALVTGARRAEGAGLPWVLAAVLLPAVTTAVVLAGASDERWPLVAPVLVVLAVVVVLSLAVSLVAAVRRRSSPVGRPVALALGVAVLAVCAFAVGTTLAAPLGAAAEGQGGLVEARHGGVPQVSFAYGTTETADGTRLTVTHDGGDQVRAGNLHVEARAAGGLVAVPGANQTREGSWNGTTTRVTGGPHAGVSVAPGDSVAVGVRVDCVIRLVFREEGDAATLGKYECGSEPGR